MKIINDKIVQHVTHLARIELDASSTKAFTRQLERILEYIKKLQEVDIEGIEPTSHPLKLSNVTRDDIPSASLTQEESLSNAPDSQNGFFKVPKIIESK